MIVNSTSCLYKLNTDWWKLARCSGCHCKYTPWIKLVCYTLTHHKLACITFSTTTSQSLQRAFGNFATTHNRRRASGYSVGYEYKLLRQVIMMVEELCAIYGLNRAYSQDHMKRFCLHLRQKQRYSATLQTNCGNFWRNKLSVWPCSKDAKIDKKIPVYGPPNV